MRDYSKWVSGEVENLCFGPDHGKSQRLPWQPRQGKVALPAPHQTWCTAGVPQTLKGVAAKDSGPSPQSYFCIFAFLALVLSFLGLSLRGLGQRPSTGTFMEASLWERKEGETFYYFSLL